MKFLTVLLTLMLINTNANAKRLNEAQKAKEQGLSAVTIFVDITSVSRKKHAASKMTKLHQQFAKQGYELLSIATYNENGDFEGFFVSYKLKEF